MTEIQVFDREAVLLRERDEARAELARYRAWWNALTEAITPSDFMDKRTLPQVQAQALLRAAAEKLLKEHRRALITLDYVARTLVLVCGRWASVPHHRDDCPKDGGCDDCLLSATVDAAHSAARAIVPEGGPR